MVGKNNRAVKVSKQGTKIETYGIKKFKVGTASVVIGASIFFGAGVAAADEDLANNTTDAKTTNANDEKGALAEEAPKAVATPKAENKEATTQEVAAAVENKVEAKEVKTVDKSSLEANIAKLEAALNAVDSKKATASTLASAKVELEKAKALVANKEATAEEVAAQTKKISEQTAVVSSMPKVVEVKKEEKTEAKPSKEVETSVESKKETLKEVKADLATYIPKAKELKAEESTVVIAEEALEKVTAILENTDVTVEELTDIIKKAQSARNKVANVVTRATSGLRDARNGESLNQGTSLRAGVTTQADDKDGKITDASVDTGKKWLEDNGYARLEDVPVTTDKAAIAKLNDQIQWLNFSDDAAWENLKDNKKLQVGSKFKKEIAPNYVVTLTVKELKPFNTTEVYKERVAGTAHEASYDANTENGFNATSGTTGLGGAVQTQWAEVKSTGLDTGRTQRTVVMGTNNNGGGSNGTYAGVVFNVSATYNGKSVKPGIVMTSGEEVQRNEAEIYTTNGTPWNLVATLGGGSKNKNVQYLPNTANIPQGQQFREYASMNFVTDWTPVAVRDAIKDGIMLSKDTVTGGLGSQVFGPFQNNGRYATPIISTSNATEVGFYIMTSGQQATMIGITLSDFGDLPETYGVAEHYLKQDNLDYATNSIKQIQQPYLGRVKADIDTESGKSVRGVGSDDATENADEGIAQLFADGTFKINKDTNEAETELVRETDGKYSITVVASANGNENYTDTLAPAYVRGFIDFNQNGKFDDGEESEIVTVTGNNENVKLVFNNKQVIDPKMNMVNFRVRIATTRAEIERPVGIAYSGEVEDNQIQVPILPTGDIETTTGKQGEVQSVGIEFVNHSDAIATDKLGSNNGKTTFNSYGKLLYTTEGNVISTDTTKAKQTDGVMIVNPDGSLTREYTEAGVGTYKITDDKVEFTPLANFVGTAKGIVLRAVDGNGQSTGWTALTDIHGVENVNDGTHTTATKTMDAVYIPTVTPKELEATPKTSTGLQGKAQKETPTFNFDNDKDTAVSPSAQYPAKLVDPATGQVTDAATVDAQNEAGEKIGTYTINPTTGEITFQPNPDFVGTPKPATVSLTTAVGQDKDGNPVTKTATTTYTPTVTGVTPTAQPATTKNIQGAEQVGTPTFTAGNTDVPMATDKFKLLDKDGKEVADGATTPAYAEDGTTVIGTYSIDKATGKVTFTPTDKTYVGKVTPAKVQGEDTNGTKVTTTYTPEIVGVKPTATPSESTGIQGSVQDGTVKFAPGKATIDGEEKEVPIKANSAVLLDATGNPVAQGTPVDALDPEGNKVGEYTIDPATNKVTFTPTDKTYVGVVQPAKVQAEDENGTKVQTTYTPNIIGTRPTATPATSKDVQGATQEKEVTFTAGSADINGNTQIVPLATDKFTLLGEDGNPATSVPAKDPNGKEIGTYTLKVVDGKPVAVFTPTDKSYAGAVQPVTIQGEDTNGTKVTTTYTPEITPVKPTATPSTSKDVQGAEQVGTPVFTEGDTKVPMAADKFKLLDKDGQEVADGATTPAYAEDGTTVIGTYSIDKATGKVTFTPTDKTYAGKVTPAKVQGEDTNGTKVETTYTPEIVPATPTATPVATTDIQGAIQEGTPTFTGGEADVDGTKKTVAIDETVPAKLIDPTTGQPTDETTVTVKGEGTYTIDPTTGKVTFKPEPQFTGTAKGVEVRRVDTNGMPATAKYTPTVLPVTPTATPVATTDIQGATQEGTPVFTGGEVDVDGTKKTVAIDETVPAKLIDPATGQPTDETTVTVKGEGTYTIDPTTGKVTFKPEPQFTGTAKGVEVRRVDKNGTPATAKYTPTVTPVTPTATPATSTNVQGATQEGTVTFAAGKATVDGVEKEVPIKANSAVLLDATGNPVAPGTPVDALDAQGNKVGEYTIDPATNKVTFTPTDKTYTGTVQPAKVQAEDENGTKVQTTYTPTIVGVTPIAVDKTSEGPKGQPQSETPVFVGGKVTVDGKVITVEIDETIPAKLIDPTTGQPTDETTVTVKGEGTYTIDKATGKVTFTPEPEFTGTAKGVEVRRVDKNGVPATAKYTPTVRPETKHVDKEGKEIPGYPAEDGTKEPKSIPGYKLVETKKDEKGNVTHVYEKVTTSYLDKEGNPIPGYPTEEGTKESKSIPGYKLVETKVLPNGDTQHVYEKVTTSYLDKEGNPIPGYPTEEGTKESKSIPGYKLVETKVLPNGDTQHIYAKVTTSYLDKEGNPIPGTTTEEGTKEPKSIPGYKLVETKVLPNGDTQHVYEKVTTSYITEDGKEIPGYPVEEGTKEPKSIPGYKLVGTKVLPNGDTQHIYAKVTTSYITEDGKEIPGYPVEEGTKEPKSIPGYKLVGTKVLPNGDTQHIYAKISTQTPTTNVETSYVDENGNPIRPTEKGAKDKKDIPGYEYVRTVVDANGNVRHIYRKVVTPAKAKQLPNTDATNNAGNAAGLTLVGLIAAAVAARRRKDK